MNNRTLVSIIVSSVLVIIIGLLLYLRQYQPKYKWYRAYRIDREQPYDMKFFYQLLKDSYPEDKFHYISGIDQFKNTSSKKLIINLAPYFNSLDSVMKAKVEEFVSDGMGDLLYLSTFSSVVSQKIKYEYDTTLQFKFYRDSIIESHFLNESRQYSFHYQVLKDTAPKQWTFIDFIDSVSAKYAPLGVIDSNRINLAEFRKGRGKVFLYTTPELLTNYYLANESGFEHASELFKTIGSYDEIYWLNNRIKRQLGNNRGTYGLSDNPMDFILEKKSLRWAWYVSIGALFLFLIFKLKRQQNPIPIIMPDKNTSIEYARAVGLLYHKSNTHEQLAGRLFKLFLAFAKHKYGINLTDDEELQIKKIAIKSGVEEKLVRKIFKEQFKIRYNPEPDKQQTINLHASLEAFYKKCK